MTDPSAYSQRLTCSAIATAVVIITIIIAKDTHCHYSQVVATVAASSAIVIVWTARTPSY